MLVSAAGRLTVTQLSEIVDEAQVRSALDAAADGDVATVGAGSMVVFTHPLLASAVYEAAAPGEATMRCRSVTWPSPRPRPPTAWTFNWWR